MEKATFYNYLTNEVVELNNDEIYYSLYMTDEKHILLLLVNKGGTKSLNACAVGVTVRLNLKKTTAA